MVSTVHYATVDGTATAADHDYEPTSGTLTFAVGERTKHILVVIDGDDKVEPDEVFDVHLDIPTAAILTHADGLGTILNDDVPAAPIPTPTPTPGCVQNANIVQDGGFEETTFDETTETLVNPRWTSSSTLYDTSICSIEGCGTAEPPRTGDNWVWFDGTGSVDAESGIVRQKISIPLGSTATLSYYLRVAEVTAPSTSKLTVTIDGTVVQTINEPAAAESAYRLRTVDLSAFANGQPRLLSFNYDRPAGTTGSDSFLIDDVTLSTSCAASLATVDGKVLTADLRGVRNTTVSMTNSQGVVRTATTSSFGFFSFANVVTADTYTIRISSRLYRFSPQTVQVNGNLTLPDFVGLE